MITQRRFRMLFESFFDGFGFTGRFTRWRRHGAPESYFRRDQESEQTEESPLGSLVQANYRHCKPLTMTECFTRRPH
jgi:hypothetical protein